MLSIKPVDFMYIQKFFCDFQKHSKCFEMPPDEGQCVGVYEGDKLAGYFIVLGLKDKSMLIFQGYWKKEYRHKNLSKEAMNLLEQRIKKAGYTKIRLQTLSRFRSYVPFMKYLGYKVDKICFSKEI